MGFRGRVRLYRFSLTTFFFNIGSGKDDDLTQHVSDLANP